MENPKQKTFIFLIFFFILGVNTCLALARFLAQKSEQPFLLGLSFQRLILALCILIVSSFLCAFFYQNLFKTGWFFKQTQKRLAEKLLVNRYLFWLLFLGYLLFVAITLPSYRLGEFQGYWRMAQPLILFLFLSFFIFLAFLFITFTNRGQKSFQNLIRFPFRKVDLIILGCILLCIEIILLLFKFGLIQDQFYWNVAAVPILNEYVYLLLGFVFFLPAFVHVYQIKQNKFLSTPLLIVIIFLLGNSIIQHQEIARNHFIEIRSGSPEQVVPYSDALIYDLAGKEFINGFGIGYEHSNDKPLYNAYTGLLHFFMGENYQDIIKLNVFILALIPVVLFLIGKSLDSTQVGIIFAFAGILFEVTSFQSSGYIANIHWKLLMPEPLGQLLVLVAAMGTIRWLKDNQQKKWVYLTGIALGMGSYIRPQIVVLSIAFIFILLINPGRKYTHRLLAAGHGLASFLLFSAPWAIYCQIHYGYIPLFSKFNWILNYRFLLSSTIQNSITHVKNAAILPILSEPSSISVILEKFYVITVHFLNNIIKALLSLPYSLQMDTVPEIFKGILYWDETANWHGEVSVVFFFSLIVFCIGLIGLYRKKKIIGIVPLIYMLFYFAALSLSRTSGSRYLVPVIWVVYLYYFFGIVLIARYLISFYFEPNPAEDQNQKMIRPMVGKKEKFASFYFIIPLILGLIVPIMDMAIPKNQNLTMDEDQINERLSQSMIYDYVSIRSSQWEDLLSRNAISYGYGELVYPEIKAVENSTTQFMFRFNLVGSHPLVDVKFPLQDFSAEKISAIDLKQPYVVLACNQENSSTPLAFLMQTKDKQLLLLSKQNLDYCQKQWLLLAP